MAEKALKEVVADQYAKTVREVAWLLDEQVREHEAERASFDDWLQHHDDYPPKGWNEKYRRRIEQRREQIDLAIEQAIMFEVKDNFLVAKPLLPWERHEAMAKFYVDVVDFKAARAAEHGA